MVHITLPTTNREAARILRTQNREPHPSPRHNLEIPLHGVRDGIFALKTTSSLLLHLPQRFLTPTSPSSNTPLTLTSHLPFTVAIKKALFSFFSRTPLPKDKSQSLPTLRRTDSKGDLGAWFLEIDDKGGMQAQWNWIQKHKAEVRAGKQLIEREMHLSALLSYLYNTVDDNGSLSSAQEDEMLKYETELKQINHDYIEHQERMTELDTQRPAGRLAEDRYYLHRRQTNPEAWTAEQYSCQSRGGCCARDCGCCERNLRIVRDRKGGMQYVHCGPGCDCCKRHHGELQISSSLPIQASSPM